MRWLSGRHLVLLLLALLAFPATAAEPRFTSPWPERPAVEGQEVSFPTTSPFALTDQGEASMERAQATLFLPPEASAADPVPAVVLLHGAGGVLSNRERLYGAQFAAQGVAALVVDSFTPRRSLARGFVERILNITEVMILADAYAALRYLDQRPEVEGARVAVIGYSYGALAATLAAYEQVAETFAPGGPRFAAHVGFYGPCIVRLADPETTGAPVLLLWGGGDALVDPDRCAEVVADLERGGSSVRTIVYPEALHQWDGGSTTPWRAGRNLAACSYRVEPDGTAWDAAAQLPIVNPAMRQLSLSLCTTTDGYLIGRDDAIRAQSNRALAEFLTRTLSEDAATN